MKECSTKGSEERMLARIATLEKELADKRMNPTPTRGTPSSARNSTLLDSLLGSGSKNKNEAKETPKDKFEKMRRGEE